jgi:hypothetical protein
MLLGLGVWRMILFDWKGIVFFIVAMLCLFIRSGILIDPDNKKLKRYTGFFAIKIGEWENINDLIRLGVIKTRETQSMNVLSLTRNETKEVLKLMMVLPGKRIELMTGEKETLFSKAERISSVLHVPVDYTI